MTSETTTASALSDAQQQRLSAILDTVLPASEDGTMPSAGELDFLIYLREQAEDFMPTLGRIVDNFDDAFPGQALSSRVALMKDYATADTKTFDDLLFHIYDCYYQDNRVRTAIGVLPGAIFPQGNVIQAGDLSLLVGVAERSQGYRR
ncbi:MAG: hypothetical protein HOB79_20210 [Rhodospirillaceae bacterium]|jgi:hypothetical protein|nr:hypothetical protein [Rhodospirillaceae bacterium]